jgi:hypothetical protein
MRKMLAMTVGLALLSGCASWFIHGAKLADSDLAAGQKGGFKVTGCTNLADNSPMPGPDTTYHFVNDEGRTALFERSADGTGAVIQNKWTAEDGEHYFAWVQSSGWEYVVPQGGTPTRIVYAGFDSTTGDDGVTRPTSRPTATCAMVPIDGT